MSTVSLLGKTALTVFRKSLKNPLGLEVDSLGEAYLFLRGTYFHLHFRIAYDIRVFI